MTNSNIDYLARHDAKLIEEGSATRLVVGDKEVLFEKQSPEKLGPILNRAIDFTVAFFNDNRVTSPIQTDITEHQIEQIAIAVVIRFLYTYNLWKANLPEHRDRELVLADHDLQHPYTSDEVLFYCESVFPESYQSEAASLLGITPENFAEWERGRREFWDMR
ncbi:MAG: hypothetical protein HUJ26_02115 [Planctomycetaceae bacterium]|nr:hypothetical protein [Planctomycetaceae bacterium]